MINLMKKRDRWEAELGARKAQTEIFFNKFGYMKTAHEEYEKAYKIWLKENNIEPYKVKFPTPLEENS